MTNHNGNNGKKNVYACTTESLCCTAESNTALQINYTSVTKQKRKENTNRYNGLKKPSRTTLHVSTVLSKPLIFFSLWKGIQEKQTEQRASQVALEVKNPPANAGDVRDVGSIPGLRGSPGGGHSNPLQYSCLENPIVKPGGLPVHGVAKSQTWLKRSDLIHTCKLLGKTISTFLQH